MNKREKEVMQYQLAQEKQVLRQLERQYNAALSRVNVQLALLQSKEETASRINRINYQKALKSQIAAILDKLHRDEYQTIHQFVNECYESGYIGMMYNLAGQGIPVIMPVDSKAAAKAVVTDSKLKHELYEELGVDVERLKKTISKELTRGIATGLPYDDIARNIRMLSGAPMRRAKTIVRTEAHRIQQASQEDARQHAKSKGANVVKQWDATLDGATRRTHRELDGQIRELNEPFEMHGKKAMYPGDFNDPAEDCNCRCVALTRARKALDADELKIMEERAGKFKLDKTKDFTDFRAKYMRAVK